MGQKHLIKTITHSRRVGAKIMKQSKQVSLKLTKLKQTTKKEGRAKCFAAITRKIDTGLPGPNVQIEIGCHVNRVESLSQLYECCF